MRTHLSCLGFCHVAVIILAVLAPFCAVHAQSPPANAVVLLGFSGKGVEVQRARAGVWDRAYTNMVLNVGDQLRTGPESTAFVRLSDRTIKHIGVNGYMVLSPARRAGGVFRFLRGIYYFLHRDDPGVVEFETPTVSAVVRGTEFVLQVEEDGTTTLSLIDGEVLLANEHGELVLTSGQRALTLPNQAPRETARIDAINLIQWCLYYPAVLHLDDLGLPAADQRALQRSLQSYREGDLLTALSEMRAADLPRTTEANLYQAALLLAIGQVERSQEILNPLLETPGASVSNQQIARALQELIAAVQNRPDPIQQTPELATAWLARSYTHQATSELEAALRAAQRAVQLAPEFAFGWARVAELEFSFGRREHARQALRHGLRLGPKNPQAISLQGFLLAARYDFKAAIETFNRAIAIDSALGNAWLGRGLCRIRQGDSVGGREDLQIAATLEPQRAILRSYLGKAFSHDGDNVRAEHELDLAKQFDENDPTPYLYSALLNQQGNRINEGIRDLETSQELNKNRSVYRSRLLLDQDSAVRGANLAQLYQDANMSDVALREAARAINSDYANYSAHYFLANSFNGLRGEGRADLRFETLAVNEYLVGNLLAPPGAGSLSPQVTQQEFSRLFERNRLGLVSATEYTTRGDWLQSAVQYGNFGASSYAAEFSYRFRNGDRPNNELEQYVVSLKYKLQVSDRDSIYLQGIYSDTETGDLTRYYDQNSASKTVSIKETQEPIALVGFTREWTPGSYTLFLGGRLQDTLNVDDVSARILSVARNGAGQVIAVGIPNAGVPPSAELDYRSEAEIYTAELQHILQRGDHTFVAGVRFQGGTFDTRSSLGASTSHSVASTTVTSGLLAHPASDQSFTHDFERLSAYIYDTFQPWEPLYLTAGLSYDRIDYPLNFRYAPTLKGQETEERLSPKAGLIWTPLRHTTLRAAYTRSLGGVSFDQSFRLEPAQVAGFNQAYRSLIPESVAGAISAPRFETISVALDQKFPTSTYLGVQAELLHSKVNRTIGTADISGFPPAFGTSGTPERLEYYERNLSFTLNQLVGVHWSLGARYRISHADLSRDLPDISTTVTPFAREDLEAILHQVNLFALFNHPCGFFSSFESIWSQQSNRGYQPDLPGDDFWQFNAYAGYRFPRRRAEIRLGLLNLTDQDYRLNPLNLTPELPRDRTFAASLRFSF